jgi:hypothetical protein
MALHPSDLSNRLQINISILIAISAGHAALVDSLPVTNTASAMP